jgi:Icc-related predicted phosphoesterase
VFRVAAAGDVHVGTDSAGQLRASLEPVADEADVLLLAGDLTKRGELAEAAVLADELRDLSLPVVAVLGNHDYESDQHRGITQRLTDAGVSVLEGAGVVIETGGGRLGIAGGKGFAGGFVGASATAFGEQEMKAFVHSASRAAAALEAAARSLAADAKVLLLHYAPIRDTLHGENPELYPMLGSYLFAEVADRCGVDLVVHGHAHSGTEKGSTPSGIPVRNVAQPVLRRPYAVYGIDVAPREPAPGRVEPAGAPAR